MGRTASRGCLGVIFLIALSGVPASPLRAALPADSSERKVIIARVDSSALAASLTGKAPPHDLASLGAQFAIGAGKANLTRLEFSVPVPGHCVFEARWSGALTCKLVVRNPAGGEWTTSGASPLHLEADAAAAHAGAGLWRVSLLPSARGSAKGELLAILPWSPHPASPAAAGTGACVTQRTIGDDGTVEVTFADGSATKFFPSGAFALRSPDGRERRAEPANVPTSSPPPPPLPDDEQISAWLAATNQMLLDEIRTLVGDDAVVNRYVKNEAGEVPDVYGQIRKRIDVIKKLH